MLTTFGNLLNPARKERIFNELISNIASVPADQAATHGAEKLILLNSILPKPDEVPIAIQPRRHIILVKHILDWFSEDNEEANIGPGLIVEVSKTLKGILPQICTLYGGHWRQVLDFIKDCWMVSFCNSIRSDDMLML